MIPVQEQPEPDDFAEKVGWPGADFLAQNARPSSWKNREYWRRAIPDLYISYSGICAYCAEWIPRNTGTATVDHFIPRAIEPALAYQWSNFRLASLLYNARKGDYDDVLDPFTLRPTWFILIFPALLVAPNPELSTVQAAQVRKTRDRLGLNDEISYQSRYRWIKAYCNEQISFDYLKRNAPFIGYELERQNLIEEIKLKMRG